MLYQPSSWVIIISCESSTGDNNDAARAQRKGGEGLSNNAEFPSGSSAETRTQAFIDGQLYVGAYYERIETSTTRTE